MNPRDGHVHLGQYHEQLGVWVEGYLEEEGLAWGPLSSAALSTIALKVMCSTPRRFAECFFENRPEHGGGPWRFLEPLQTDSIDYPYNTANESAYGTGKTRELTAYNLHTVGCTEGSILFVAHSMTARQQVWDEIEFQLSRSAFLARIFPREAVTRGNNPELRGRVGNAAKFKLTTRGGRQIHSLHIGMGYLLGDECDLWPEDAWNAFLSRRTQGTYRRIYSVPNGKPSSRFAQIAKSARPLEEMRLDTVAQREREIQYAYVHWERPMFGPPIWDEQEAEQAVIDFGPKEGPQYQIYVLGRRTQSNQCVFSRADIDAMFTRVPGYRCTRIVWDHEQRTVNTSVNLGLDFAGADTRFAMRRIFERSFSADDFSLRGFVEEHMAGLPFDVVGFDCGRRRDPAELGFFEVTPVRGLRLRGRIQLLYVPTDVQERLLISIGKGETLSAPKYGFGIEASGSTLAQPIYEAMVGRHGGVSPHDVTAYDWNQKEDLVQNGKVALDKNRNPIKRTLKEAATCGLEALIAKQRAGGCGYLELHCDPTLVTEFENHTADESGSFGRKFADEDDHFIEATRVAFLRQRDVLSKRGSKRTRVAGRTVKAGRAAHDYRVS